MEHRAPTTLLPVGANEQTACTHPLLFINNCYLVSIILSLKIAYLLVVPTLGGIPLGPVHLVPPYPGSQYANLTDVFGAQPC